jgi:thioredoxin 1
MVKQVGSLSALEAEFQAAGSKAVVVDFYAQWCGPCKMIAPKIDAMSQKYTNVVFLKVDVDEAPDVSEKYDIQAMPTFKIFKNGKKVDEMVGASAEKLEDLVKKHN